MAMQCTAIDSPRLHPVMCVPNTRLRPAPASARAAAAAAPPPPLLAAADPAAIYPAPPTHFLQRACDGGPYDGAAAQPSLPATY